MQRAIEIMRNRQRHARIEARDVLSVGQKFLSGRDWSAIEKAYDAIDDPLARSRSRADCVAALSATGNR